MNVTAIRAAQADLDRLQRRRRTRRRGRPSGAQLGVHRRSPVALPRPAVRRRQLRGRQLQQVRAARPPRPAAARARPPRRSSRASSAAASPPNAMTASTDVAVLALQVTDQRQPLLGGGARCGVEVDRFAERGGVAAQLLGLGGHAVRPLDERREPIVVRRRRLEGAQRAAQRVERRALVADASRRPRRRSPRSSPRAAPTRTARLDLRLLAGSQRGGRRSPRPGGGAARGDAPARARSVSSSAAAADRRAPGALPASTDGGDIVAAEAVEQLELAVAQREALLLVLAVDLRQPRPQRGQRRRPSPAGR